MSGRVTTIDVVNTDTEVMYAATASGGLWKSISSGIKWTAIFDSVRVLIIGQLQLTKKTQM